jgi:hypothetical protein
MRDVEQALAARARDGSLTRVRRKNVKAYLMSTIEAAKLLCEAHTRTTEEG